MEIADQRHVDAKFAQPVANVRHGFSGFIAIDGDAHKFRAGAGEVSDLADGACNIGGIGVGHRLHNHRRAATDFDAADANRNRLVASGQSSRGGSGHCA